jgi:hypothetical protein
VTKAANFVLVPPGLLSRRATKYLVRDPVRDPARDPARKRILHVKDIWLLLLVQSHQVPKPKAGTLEAFVIYDLLFVGCSPAVLHIAILREL